jgi:predicted tellurium resistance membrane protein TerC
LGSKVLVGIGSFLIGLGHLALVASAVYLIAVVFKMLSGGEASGIPLGVGIFGGAFCYLLGDAFKKSGATAADLAERITPTFSF